MANIASAKKRIRQTGRESSVNRIRISTMRTYLRHVEEAIAGGDKTKAEAAFREAQPLIMRSAQKRVLHTNTASRKLSRLSHRIKSMSA